MQLLRTAMLRKKKMLLVNESVWLGYYAKENVD